MELGIRLGFVKISEFQGGGGRWLNRNPPPSVRHWLGSEVRSHLSGRNSESCGRSSDEMPLNDWEKQVKSERVLPQVRCEHRYTGERLRSQLGQRLYVFTVSLVERWYD
jgi:hypothetical protein